MNHKVARRLYLGLQLLRGEPVAEALADVRRSERFGLEQLLALQMSRQREQLLFAARFVPYYRQLLAPLNGQLEAVRDHAEMSALRRQLPVLEKATVQEQAEQLRARGVGPLPCHPDRTSGSTGTPLIFPCDQRAWAYRHALTFRTMQAFGVRLGDPYAYFVGLPWGGGRRWKLRVRDWVLNRSRICAFEIGPDRLARHVRQLRWRRPVCFLGYPSALYDFCLLCREHDLDLRRLKLKGVFLSSEPVHDYQRRLISEVTGAPCCNLYGSAEGGLNAFECPAGGLHLTLEATWLELRDPAAQAGEILVTDLMLRTSPLVRYAVGDEVRLSSRSCDCGRAHPLIESVEGRRSEPILLPNGRRINANVINYLFKDLAPLAVFRRCRFVETPAGRLELQLMVAPGFREEHRQQVVAATLAAMGEDLPLDVVVVERMPDLPNAKHRDYVPLRASGPGVPLRASGPGVPSRASAPADEVAATE